jgi:hypothetical protein
MKESHASSSPGLNRFLARIVKGDATKDQAKDTGMAIVLILFLIWLARRRDVYIVAAMLVHLVTMIAPQVFRPFAVIWFGVSHLLGIVGSRVILTLIFFLVVTPVAFFRRLSGADPLQLKRFKGGTGSVMKARDHTFIGEDLEQPY